MNPQDALKILDVVCSQANMNRQQHIECQQAVMILANLVNPKPVQESDTIPFPGKN